VLLGGAAPSTPPAPNVVTTYGMTETGSGVIYDGLPLNGIEIRLGDEGEILVRGPMLLRCYRDGTDPTDEDGWLATGDRGRWAEDRLLVEGRADDLIITGGENVWPQPVEAAIQARADIASAAVVGLPDAEWGQRVAAHVVVAAGHEAPSLTDIRATVQAVLPRWHAPKELVIASTLPRTPSGKLRRSALRA
jgi:O-succinylbenzoic acid--CoA ligase